MFVDTFSSFALRLTENHYYITPISQNISHVHMRDIPQKQQNVLPVTAGRLWDYFVGTRFFVKIRSRSDSSFKKEQKNIL